MRESPSGPANVSAVLALDGITVQPAAFANFGVNAPGAKPGDTVAWSVDALPNVVAGLIPQFSISNNNTVDVNLYNVSGNSITVTSANLYLEVLPRG